jgi:ABC-2 type transport system ATP-binding protein
MTDSPLVAEGIGRHYRRGRPWALRDVSVVVPSGSIAALVGPNGAGKSTFIRACVGFERLDAGRLLVNGLDPAKRRTAVVDSIGYVPQGGALYRPLSIADHFDLARAARPGFDRTLAAERVIGVGLDPRRSVGELSSGEQAQVALSLALATKAPLLLLDEPLASLDPLARRTFLTTLVGDVRARGATALLSSHIVTDIEQACDRIIVLSHGGLLLDAAVSEARATHRTVGVDEAEGRELVGTFAGPGGELLVLVRGLTGRQATLEEIVLGYLAGARAAAVAPVAA